MLNMDPQLQDNLFVTDFNLSHDQQLILITYLIGLTTFQPYI